MKKSLILAAALSALAFGSAGTASAAVASGQLGGVRAAHGTELVQTVHYKRHWHQHRKQRHCAWRWGKKRCWWR